MELFGWIVLGFFATLGFALVVLLALPYLISLCKTLAYKAKKDIEIAKEDAEARANSKAVRVKKLREKETLLEDKKLLVKLNKLDTKIAEVDKEIKLQEAVKEIECTEESLLKESAVENNN